MRPVFDPEKPQSARQERVSGIETRARKPAPDVDSPVMRELGLAEGTLVDGVYRIIRPLGAGGMGVVTLAHDERLDRDVAVKFVRPELFEHANLRELFHVEARAMARVTHPNVLTVHAFGEHDGVPYFVMEYVDGPTVEDWLERHRAHGTTPEIAAAVRILDQVLMGVEAIHAASTVHRDLKPSIVLLHLFFPWTPFCNYPLVLGWNENLLLDDCFVGLVVKISVIFYRCLVKVF